MHIILGGTGHIGSALTQRLLERGERVTVITRDASKAGYLQEKGAQIAIAEVEDVAALRHVFRAGRRLFLLNPPALPSTDTDAQERKTLASILQALDGSGLEKIVAESTYGAQPGEHVGDLGVLYEMEQALATSSIPVTIMRGAYYMSNWLASLSPARDEGVVHTFYPPEFKLPMVDPADIGRVAADLMMEPVGRTGLHYVEGPERYSSNDVASAFAAVLQKPVKALQTPPEQWLEALKVMGFSPPAAQSFARMMEVTLEGAFPPEEVPIRGATSLQSYLKRTIRD